MLATVRRALVLLLAGGAICPVLAAPSARSLYTRALEREQAVRPILEATSPDPTVIRRARTVIANYEQIVRLHPRSGYCDDALWNGAELAATLWARFGQDQDRRTAIRLYRWLAREYPTSSFVARAQAAERRLEKPPARAAAPPPRPAPSPKPAVAAPPVSQPAPPARTTATAHAQASEARTLPLIRDIRRMALPGGIRVIVELDEEVPFHQERIADPDRVFIDFRGVQAAPDLQLPRSADEGIVRQIRLGQHPDDTVRVVLDLDGATRYSVFALYSPYRLVIDCDVPAAAPVAASSAPVPAAATGGADAPVKASLGTTGPPRATSPAAPDLLPHKEAPVVVPAGPPAANLLGRFSLSRQLGLGVARIVIDPGHGGRDPGARARNLTEADVVLDVALRLEKLLLEQPGFEVVMTRRTNVYVPLEERTAIANRVDADLFLSIHANASRNRQANGIETYFLNFATTPDAEEVAARENAASEQTMHRLPDIVKAITLNNKLAESRDFATFVQRAMVERLRGVNKQVRDLGVKQAPFVVLIGAGMPSILAEISFLTHAEEGRLLQTEAYRQRIAEALLAGVLRYQKSLKNVQTTLAQSE